MLSILLLFAGCINSEICTKFDLEAMEGFIAYSVAYHSKDKNTKQDSVQCSCNGTGYVQSGDGLMRVKCPCGDNCKCAKTTTQTEEKPEPKPEPKVEIKPEKKTEQEKQTNFSIPVKYIKLYTAKEGCTPCKTQERIIEDGKWIVVDENKGKPFHILRTLYPHLSQAPSGIAIPKFELIVNEQVVKVNEGVLTNEELIKFFTEDK